MSLLTQASLVVTPNANKSGKLYSVIPSNGNGDFTVTRATTATRTNSSGLIETTASGMVRRDYSLGSCPNLLLEPQRTNLALRSEEFDNASWVKTQTTVTANSTISPSGVQNADTLIENTANNNHFISQQFTKAASSLTYSYSIYFKNSSGTRNIALAITNGTSSGRGVVFSSSGAILASNVTIGTGLGFTYVSGEAIAIANGWYKATIVVTTDTATRVDVVTYLTSTSSIDSYLGNGTSGYAIWGAQLEAGAYATSYIPTTLASVTRNADVITRDNLFTNGLITASGGTWFVDLKNTIARTRDAFSQSLFIGVASTGVGSDGFAFTQAAGSSRLIIRKYIAAVETVVWTLTVDNAKIAIKWNGTTADIFQNGTKVVTATAFSGTNMQWMVCNGVDVPKNINQMALFPTPLTDTQCTQLTTL